MIVDRPYVQAWDRDKIDVRPIGVHVNKLTMNKLVAFSADGTALNFGKDGNGLPYIKHGFSWPSKKASWMLGPSSGVLIPLLQHGNDISLTMKLAAFVPHKKIRDYQDVDILINGKCQETIRVKGWGDYTIGVPARCNQQGFLDIEFRFPHAQSHKQAKTGSDERIFGVSLTSLKFKRK